jgi:hypothetical protein
MSSMQIPPRNPSGTIDTAKQYPPVAFKSRVGVVETVYYQLPKEQPTSVQTRYFREVDSIDQAYVRSLVATEEWSPLVPESCWVKEPSLLIVKNLEGLKTFTVYPTEKQKREALAKVLDVGVMHLDGVTLLPFAAIATGESMRLQPTGMLVIRSRSGDARFSLYILPS